MIVLGLDPSLTGYGHCVIDTENPIPLLQAGAWITWPDRFAKSVTADNAERFAYLAKQLWTLSNEVRPERIFVEGTVFVKGKMTAATIHALARCRGFADVVGAALNVQVIELSPQNVKKGLGIVVAKGEGLASKAQVRETICALYTNAADLIPSGLVGDNASDSIAVATVGLSQAAFADRLRASGP